MTLYILIMAAVFLLDQATKFLIQYNEALQYVEIIRGFFKLYYVKNTGAAWSMFSSSTGVLTLISAAAIGVMLWYMLTKKPDKMTNIALSLMIGGAAGNLADRLFLQYVRDFLSFNIFGYDFPVFNIADSALTIGVFLLLVMSFFGGTNDNTNL